MITAIRKNLADFLAILGVIVLGGLAVLGLVVLAIPDRKPAGSTRESQLAR